MCSVCGCGHTDEQHEVHVHHHHKSDPAVIEIEQSILTANDSHARDNRDWLPGPGTQQDRRRHLRLVNIQTPHNGNGQHAHVIMEHDPVSFVSQSAAERYMFARSAFGQRIHDASPHGR